jgi:di/tricarboxylate transporter
MNPHLLPVQNRNEPLEETKETRNAWSIK